MILLKNVSLSQSRGPPLHSHAKEQSERQRQRQRQRQSSVTLTTNSIESRACEACTYPARGPPPQKSKRIKGEIKYVNFMIIIIIYAHRESGTSSIRRRNRRNTSSFLCVSFPCLFLLILVFFFLCIFW